MTRRILRFCGFVLVGLALVWACPFDNTLREYLSVRFWLPFAKMTSSFERPKVRRADAPYAGMTAATGNSPLERLRAIYQGGGEAQGRSLRTRGTEGRRCSRTSGPVLDAAGARRGRSDRGQARYARRGGESAGGTGEREEKAGKVPAGSAQSGIAERSQRMAGPHLLSGRESDRGGKDLFRRTEQERLQPQPRDPSEFAEDDLRLHRRAGAAGPPGGILRFARARRIRYPACHESALGAGK